MKKEKLKSKEKSQIALKQVFFCEFGEIFKTIFFYRTPPVADSMLR